MSTTPDSDAQSVHAREPSDQVQELEHDLIARDRELTAAHYRIKALKSEIRLLHREVGYWKSVVAGMVESRSWKLMAPARLAARVWRKLNRRAAVPSQEASGTSQTDRNTGDQVPPDAEPPTISTTLTRAEILEHAWEDLTAGTEDTTTDGRYVHDVPHKIDAKHLGVRAVAFYKPQPSNDDADRGTGGRGDWRAVGKAVPRYLGQSQPNIPDDLGYYDLRVAQVLHKQVELANQYGIYGFCFQYDNMADVEVRDLPLKQLLSDRSLSIGFCISIDEGAFNPENDRVVNLMVCALSDNRYIRVAGKPVLLIGHDDGSVARRWREWATTTGLSGLFLIARRAPAGKAVSADFDAVLEDPIASLRMNPPCQTTLIDNSFQGETHNYSSLLDLYVRSADDRVALKNVITAWDTEPREPGRGTSLVGSNPALYSRCLDRCCRIAIMQQDSARLLFITAWNDWGSGAYLEPDHRFGYAYLHATANVLRNYFAGPKDKRITSINSGFQPRSEVAIVFHCFYEDLIEPLLDEYLTNAKQADLFVTSRVDLGRKAIEAIRDRFDNVFFEPFENRGRDIRPFLFTFRRIQELGYRFGCKVHTKKTPQVSPLEGEIWRQGLMKTLLGADDCLEQVIERFRAKKNVGLLVPSGCLVDLRDLRHHIDNTFWLDRLLSTIGRNDLAGNYSFDFPAGSMYWFRVDALSGFENLALPEDSFEAELGQRDGTLAHALERLVALYARCNGFEIEEIDVSRSGIKVTVPLI